jgi:hypothetical protein
MDNTKMIRRSPALVSVESASKSLITFCITADDEGFTFEPDNYQYFICFEDGAIGTSRSVNLGTQIRIEE